MDVNQGSGSEGAAPKPVTGLGDVACGPFRAHGNKVQALDGGRWFTIAVCNSRRITTTGNQLAARHIANALNRE